MGFRQKLIVFFVCFGIVLMPAVLVLADSQGQTKTFNIDLSFDPEQREQVSATLKKVSQQAYFYLENEWEQALSQENKQKVNEYLEALSQEFDQTIYPDLTTLFGQEWKPGIDNDQRITILFLKMKQGTAGYFRTEDESPRLQSPLSNEREMVYLNLDYLATPLLKSFLAHEFTHLITFNQKDRLRGVSEEVWLNEARADYAPSFLGYDDPYQGSHLQQRLKTFFQNPSDSLTEWRGSPADYGIITVFVNYLVDHYGVEVLAESLRSSEVGIPSLNQALLEISKYRNIEISRSFPQLFFDWSIAIFLNNCEVGEQYCYKNQNLQNIKITPSLILLPSTQKTEFSLDYQTTYWSANWYRIIGAGDNLEVTFQGDPAALFKVPYVLCKDTLDCSVGDLELTTSTSQNLVVKGELSFQNFADNYTSLTLIPFAKNKTSGFNGKEQTFDFSIVAKSSPQNEEQELIAQLEAQIVQLQAQIAELKAKIAKILSERISCSSITQNLALGSNHPQVRCLQQFLNLNPATRVATTGTGSSGKETTFFGTLTQAATIRFQEKHAQEVLTPLGLKKGTGFLGPLTRAKLNDLLLSF